MRKELTIAESKDFLTAREVVALSSGMWRSISAVYSAARRKNGLPSYKMGGRVLFSRKDLCEYIASCRRARGDVRASKFAGKICWATPE